MKLAGIVQVQTLRDAMQAWRSAAQASIAQRQQLAHACHRLGRVLLWATFQAWRGYCSYQQHLQVRGTLQRYRFVKEEGDALDAFLFRLK